MPYYVADGMKEHTLWCFYKLTIYKTVLVDKLKLKLYCVEKAAYKRGSLHNEAKSFHSSGYNIYLLWQNIFYENTKCYFSKCIYLYINDSY